MKEWPAGVPVEARYEITEMNLEILDMILATLRDKGEVYIRLSGGPQAVPSLASLALRAVVEIKK